MGIELEKVYASRDLKVTRVKLNGSISTGTEMRVPQTDKWVVTVKCENGMLGCRIYDIECADMLGLPFAVFSAPDLEDMLSSKPVKLSREALELGAGHDMDGAALIGLFSAQGPK